ncbi:unnamed protein product [Lactuca virosa]|uniref:Uncharacterized protein n=1 Tax=Lactuca virosa TaxID=75947 RepID=A0AAU9MAP8_9ASTR|nr:unnamed protein product [Lactuca virosa]
MLYLKILAKSEAVQRKTLKIFNNGNTIRHSSTLLELSTRRFRMKSKMYQMRQSFGLKLDVWQSGAFRRKSWLCFSSWWLLHLKNIKACQGTKMASISHRGISAWRRGSWEKKAKSAKEIEARKEWEAGFTSASILWRWWSLCQVIRELEFIFRVDICEVHQGSWQGKGVTVPLLILML